MACELITNGLNSTWYCDEDQIPITIANVLSGKHLNTVLAPVREQQN